MREDITVNICPVCYYPSLPYPPRDYHICPCCGTDFGNDDVESSWEELRENWIARGMNWFFEQPPANWNPWEQLLTAGYGVTTTANHFPSYGELKIA